MTARALHIAPSDDYTRPLGAVVEAQRADLREVRADATAREHYITTLEAQLREQSDVLTAMQQERATKTPRVVRTYWLANQAHVTLGALMDAVILMEAAGHAHPHFRPHRDEDGLLEGLDLVVMESAVAR